VIGNQIVSLVILAERRRLRFVSFNAKRHTQTARYDYIPEDWVIKRLQGFRKRVIVRPGLYAVRFGIVA
jgi:hypothetical protein